MMPGKFIVFEGADGSGTTVQSKEITRRLQNKLGRNRIIWTCEPSKGHIGQFLRRVLSNESNLPNEAMELLFLADRIDHVDKEIAPALRNDKVVVCDRYTMSTLVYQGAVKFISFGDIEFSKKIELLLKRESKMLLEHGFICPDFTMVLDVDPSVAAKRRMARGGDEEKYETESIQREVCSLYKGMGKTKGLNKTVLIDANKDIDKVTDHCWEVLMGLE